MDYFTGGDKPYLITGSDDHTAKVCIYSAFVDCYILISINICNVDLNY